MKMEHRLNVTVLGLLLAAAQGEREERLRKIQGYVRLYGTPLNTRKHAEGGRALSTSTISSVRGP